ncbi:MAG: hypothetical protein HONDAALG_02704 [Gammaproteobacteria bacterium]|nr:hypothetical protein [Gammaproteobacteria bacterium]
MHRLRDLQERFQRYLLEADESAVEGVFADSGGADVAVRRGVYFDAYRLRLIGALKVDYPVLVATLGEERFARIAREYMTSTRSSYYNLRWYGGSLGGHLKSSRDTAAEPWLAEMAAFEWALMAAFDSPDRDTLRVEDLAALAPEHWPEMRFILHPCVRVLHFEFEVPKLWKAHKAGEEVFGARPGAHPGRWLIWRQGLETFFRSLEPEEAVTLEVLAAGRTFAQVCERLEELRADAALRAAGLLKRWLQDGLIADMRRSIGH